MNPDVFNPQFLLTFASGAWQLGNIVSILYIMVVLRRDARSGAATELEADKAFRQSAMDELVPRIGVYILGTIVFQVLLNIFG